MGKRIKIKEEPHNVVYAGVDYTRNEDPTIQVTITKLGKKFLSVENAHTLFCSLSLALKEVGRIPDPVTLETKEVNLSEFHREKTIHPTCSGCGNPHGGPDCDTF